VEVREDEEVMEGEEGGGWEVEDDELELPPDMVCVLCVCMLLYFIYQF